MRVTIIIRDKIQKWLLWVGGHLAEVNSGTNLSLEIFYMAAEDRLAA